MPSMISDVLSTLAIVLFTVLATPRDGMAQEAASPGDGPDTEPAVAAVVNDVEILVADVEHRVRQALGTREATDQALELLRAEALEQLIDQQKVLVQLQRRGEACTEQELEVELRRLTDNLARQEKTLDDYCRSLQIPPVSLKRLLRWQLSWKRCCEKHLTEANLQQYFDRHRKEFDGTTMRVAQVLLKSTDRTDRPSLMQQAKKIREAVRSGQISFADAARKHSQSPSATDGGELGWISRDGPMPEFFGKAAYGLEQGEVSEPVASPYGVHLIQCLEIKPGQKQWQQVRGPLENAMAKHLFEWLSTRPEPRHEVRYTGNSPHFVPGTRELARSGGE